MDDAISEKSVHVEAEGQPLTADIRTPANARGLVIFAHGSGSSRLSPRNRQVAATLNDGGLATMLFDLLSEREESNDRRTAEHRFDIGLLARRLGVASDWAEQADELASLPTGNFGASTGAAAALVAGADRPKIAPSSLVAGGPTWRATRYPQYARLPC